MVNFGFGTFRDHVARCIVYPLLIVCSQLYFFFFFFLTIKLLFFSFNYANEMISTHSSMFATLFEKILYVDMSE